MIERPQYKTPEQILLRTGTQVPVFSAVRGVTLREPESVPSDPESERKDLDGNQSAGPSLNNEVIEEDRIDMENV